MFTDNYEHLFKLNKNVLGPLGEWNKVTTDILKRNAQENLDIFSENIVRLSDRVKQISSIKKPEDLLSIHKDFLAEDMTAGMEIAQRVLQTQATNIENFMKLCGALCEATATVATKTSEKK